jgi:hypothetical protein
VFLLSMKSIVPNSSLTTRVELTSRLSMISGEYTMSAPYCRASSLIGSVPMRTIGARILLLEYIWGEAQVVFCD